MSFSPSSASIITKKGFLKKSLAHKPLREILELFSTAFLLAESLKVPMDSFWKSKGRWKSVWIPPVPPSAARPREMQWFHRNCCLSQQHNLTSFFHPKQGGIVLLLCHPVCQSLKKWRFLKGAWKSIRYHIIHFWAYFASRLAGWQRLKHLSVFSWKCLKLGLPVIVYVNSIWVRLG